MVALGKEGALFGPFSSLHVLCIMLGRWCLPGIALAGGSPRSVGALEALVMAPEVTAWCGCGEEKALFGVPA